MQDYIKDLCIQYNVHLAYTNNKITVLSTGINKGIPALRVHTLFKGCPYTIKEAIEDFFFLCKNTEHALSVLEGYIQLHYGPHGYKIIPPGKEFLSLLAASQRELIVSHMVQKNFYGEPTYIKPSESILIKGDEILELDITVEGTGV